MCFYVFPLEEFCRARNTHVHNKYLFGAKNSLYKYFSPRKRTLFFKRESHVFGHIFYVLNSSTVICKRVGYVYDKPQWMRGTKFSFELVTYSSSFFFFVFFFVQLHHCFFFRAYINQPSINTMEKDIIYIFCTCIYIYTHTVRE